MAPTPGAVASAAIVSSRRDAKRALPLPTARYVAADSRATTELMRHCCEDRQHGVRQLIQRRDRPGRKMSRIANTNGMICIMRACTGSGGAGLSRVWKNIAPAISAGSTK